MKTVNLRPLLVYAFTVFVVMLWASLLFGARLTQAQGEVTGTPTDTPTVTASIPPPPAPTETPTATASALPPPPPTETATATPPPTETATATALPELPTSAPASIAQCPDLYEPDAPESNANPIQLPGQQFHTFSEVNDEDWVLFTAPVGMQIAIYTRDLGPGVDTRLELYSSDANRVLTSVAGSNFDPVLPLGSRIDYPIPTRVAGPFYVKVTNLTGLSSCATSYTLILDGSQAPTAPTVTPTPAPRVEIRSFSTNPQAIRARQTFELSLTLQNVGTAPATNVEVVIPAGPIGQGAFVPVGSAGIHSVPFLAPGQAVTVKQQLQFSPGSTALPAAQGLTVEIRWDGRVCNTSTPCTQSLSLIVYPGDDIKVPTRSLDLSPTEPNIIVRRSWTTRAGTTEDRPVPVVQGVAFELVVELHNIGRVDANDVAVEFPLSGVNASGTPTGNAAFIPVNSENRKWLIASMPPDGHALVSQTLQPINVATPPPGGFPYLVAVNYSFVSAGIPVRAAANHTIGIDVHSQPGLLAATVITPPSVSRNEEFTVKITLQDISGGGTGSVPVVNLLTSDFEPKKPESWVQACPAPSTTAANGSCTLEYRLQAKSGLASGTYTIPMEVTYLTKGSTRMVQRQDIRVSVSGPTPTPIPSPGPGTPSTLPSTGIRNVTLDPVAANEARDLDDTAAILSTGGAAEGSLVVLDRYEVEPLTISPGQPFNLTLTLHNIGKVSARQMTITWGDEAIAPLGVGRVRYAGDIAAGEAVLLQGQFVLTDPASTGSRTLPLSLAFTDGDGRTIERTENIVLLVDAARDQMLQPAPSSVQANPTMPPAASPTASSPAVETEAAPLRPLWLRLIRALLGLGD